MTNFANREVLPLKNAVLSLGTSIPEYVGAPSPETVILGLSKWQHLESHVRGADAVIHIAGVNRAPSDEEVEAGNQTLAEDLAQVIREADRPLRVVFANSIQAGNGTPYGRGKEIAAGVSRAHANPDA